MQPIRILLVEDDPGHALLIEKNLRRSGLVMEIDHFRDGQSIVDYLTVAADNLTGHACPVIFLDLNLPAMDGYQVLKTIKTAERTRKIPIVVLTTTDMPQEITKCYELGCNLFITKPVQYEEFCRTIYNLGQLLSFTKIPLNN